ncbi:MAG: hypothetical protein KatS3mg081_1569 [Gemmatimonadales bacterium]|nr:hypothetical protein HRbin33_00783 [bacterium HR33]GIW52214.1 MAG: hypothetical protein KatS3mg081_1569 [Gemmatimonadales bacterium]
MKPAPLLAAGALLLAGAAGAVWLEAEPGSAEFDHERHREVFPTCVACHSGVMSGETPWPDPQGCRSCHDGVVEEEVEWSPPAVARASNLRFEHRRHAELVLRGDTLARCSDCHTPAGAPWMTVRRAVVDQCFGCHGIVAGHLEAPDTACAVCHFPLAEAAALDLEEIASFEKPPSHLRNRFARGEVHGAAATALAPGYPVAPSCATCHARDFCMVCHVDAPEQPAIQALAPDPRSLALRAVLEAPESHQSPDFLAAHGGLVRSRLRECATCHARESCMECHRALPDAVSRLPPAGEGRGVGAKVVRRPPETHAGGYAERHGSAAAARTETCAGCHVQADCLDCHRPVAGAAGKYHPEGFLVRHPSAAYSRAADCVSCHNQGEFCSTCHQQAGLVPKGPFRSGYHDAKQMFVLGHGEAARRSLESCVTCHVENDCLACHSALGGRRFNPHGPGFDADRLRKRNPGMCTVCHGARIPG